MYIYSSTQATVSHNRFNISHPHYWTCLSDCICFVHCVAMLSQPFGLQFSQLPSDLHYYLPALFFACRGQLVAAAGFGTYLVASGCTYGLGTASFHSISFEVYFAAVSAHGFARPFRITRHHSCHCVFSKFSLLAGIARCTSLGVCGR